MEHLQQRVARQAFEHGQQHEARHLHEGLAHAQPRADDADGEADDGLGQRLHAQEPAGGRVLQQARHEAGAAAELGPAPQRQQHDDDQRDVGRHVRDAQRRPHRGVCHAAAEDRDGQEGAHHPSLLNEAATSRAAPPVSRRTSSIRAKSTADDSCA